MLLKSAKFFLYASVFSVVVVLPDTYFPFIGGKYYFFRLTVEIAAALTLLWWAFANGDLYARFRRAAKQPLFLAVSVFVLVFVLASLFAYDSHAAFWSNYERGEGGFQMLHYYLFFVLLTLLFQEEKEWKLLFKLSLIAAGAIIAYGLLSAAGVPSVLGPYYTPTGPVATNFWGRLFYPVARFQGSLGNPSYVAPYLMFAMFYALWLWFLEKAERWKFWFYIALLAVFLIFFILTQTRGAFVGLAAGIVVYWLYELMVNRRYRRGAAISLAAILLLGGVLFSFKNVPVIHNSPIGRVLEIDLKESSLQTRLWTWNSAWQGFKERPLLGWGPENFSAVFDKYFDPRHYSSLGAETWFDRAHSLIFDYLTEIGILGFLSYLAVFAVFYWQFLRKRVAEVSDWRAGLLFALPVAYWVQGLVLFDVLPIYINLFILFAFTGNEIFRRA